MMFIYKTSVDYYSQNNQYPPAEKPTCCTIKILRGGGGAGLVDGMGWGLGNSERGLKWGDGGPLRNLYPTPISRCLWKGKNCL